MAIGRREPGTVTVETRAEGIVVLRGDLKVFIVPPRAFRANLKALAVLEPTKVPQDLANGLVAAAKEA